LYIYICVKHFGMAKIKRPYIIHKSFDRKCDFDNCKLLLKHLILAGECYVGH